MKPKSCDNNAQNQKLIEPTQSIQQMVFSSKRSQNAVYCKPTTLKLETRPTEQSQPAKSHEFRSLISQQVLAEESHHFSP